MFKRFRHIFLLLTFLVFITCKSNSRDINVFFLGDSIHLNIDDKFFVQAEGNLSDQFIHTFYLHVNESNYLPIIQALKSFQNKYQLNDWLYYQLIRSTAQAISPKGENYHRYTLYKWFLLAKSGYEATLSFSEKNLLFYVRSDDNIYGIPFFKRDEKQYVCLNYHDYGKIDFEKEIVVETTLRIEEANKSFSYKITQLPDFRPDDYQIKELQFNYQDKVYHFKVKLNTQVKNMFTNYPVADFETYFNIPLSKEIKTLEYYLLLQRLRLENNLTYRIVTDGIENINNVHIPPMLTQPFIENAIEHGFRNSTKTGNIDIEFSNLNDSVLQIKVTDNGIGIDSGKKSESKAKHKSMAIDITKERLQVLNKSKKQKVTFEISDISVPGSPDSGTMVLFTIPLV